jgi:hypothetical protein
MAGKPILLDEVGAIRRGFASAELATQALQRWQRDTCELGSDAWLVWTWDTEEAVDLYNDLSDGGAIQSARAPVNRPEPCR